MPKYNPTKLSQKHRDMLLRELSIIFSKLENSNEIFKFLKDLLTESEEMMLTRRLQIAKMLIDEYTYDEIKNKLKTGYDTIKSVKYFLDFGWGGYLKAVKKAKVRAKPAFVPLRLRSGGLRRAGLK